MQLARKIFTPLSIQIRRYQVTIVGGATEIGQTLGLLLRGQSDITNLVLHDTRGYTKGVTMDLSHVPTEMMVTGYTGEDTLDKALHKSDIVIAIGGALLTPGLSLKQWMSTNTAFVKTLAISVAKLSPQPFFVIATEPLNCLVPMAAEVMRNNGQCDPKKLFGVTTLDAIRARTLYATENELDPQNCVVPVIGGHSNSTTIPLLSQSVPQLELTEKAVQGFTTRFFDSDAKVIHAKRGWAPTLSVAYSVLIFTKSLLEALADRPAHVNAFVENNDFGTSYFSGLVELNKDGVKEMLRYTELTPYELSLLEISINQLRKDVLYGKKILEMA